MIPSYLIPVVIVVTLVTAVSVYMKLSADRDERRNRRPE
jgi:fructose-specific phosphotransferase system IIC component